MTPRPGQPGRKIISSLPGNHDLGFGTGIQASVRKRFNAYFGDGSRIDVIGNHTFVSVDTVSLSALGQPQSVEEIWRPTREFLDNAQAQKKRAVMRELRVQQGLAPNLPFKHALIDTKDLAKAGCRIMRRLTPSFLRFYSPMCRCIDLKGRLADL